MTIHIIGSAGIEASNPARDIKTIQAAFNQLQATAVCRPSCRKRFMRCLLLMLASLWGVSICQAASYVNPNGVSVERVSEAIVNTPYAAKLHEFKVDSTVYQDPKSKDWLNRHIISASVITTYRGAVFDAIEFEMFTEIDEVVTLSDHAVNLVLCESEQGEFFWPGAGAIFPPTEDIDAKFSHSAKKANIYQSYFTWCSKY